MQIAAQPFPLVDNTTGRGTIVGLDPWFPREAPIRSWKLIGGAVTAVLLSFALARWCLTPTVLPVDETTLREYVGVYEWEPDAHVYLQLWSELTGDSQLVAFDESGETRVLFPTDGDRFFAGPGLAISTAIESRMEFQRDREDEIARLTWRRDDGPLRIARRVNIERWEDVRFANRDVRLAGNLIRPHTDGMHPAIILVHGSGPADRVSVLPWARFLIRHGMAVLGYDKRGVGGSLGDWNVASFDDLAGDAVAAFEYLRRRDDIDAEQIGLLGISQAGWIMPIAAVRAPEIAFMISVAGAGVSAETSLDHARREMEASGTPPQAVERIIEIMTLQYRYARTGQGWNDYITARRALASRLGTAPDNIPGTRDDPYWDYIGPLVSYDPTPTLRRLQVPTLAVFGELDNNILPEKNSAAWDAALTAGGHPDYTLRTLPKANHLQLEAEMGNNAEMVSLRRFVPNYFTTVYDWLAARVRGFGAFR